MNKKLFKNISLCILCLVFAFIPFVSLFNSNDNSVVYANSVDIGYSFHSSDMYEVSLWDIRGRASGTYTGLFNGNCKYVDNNLSVQPIMYRVSTSTSSIYTTYELLSYYRYTTRSDSNYFVNTDINNYVVLSRGVSYKILSAPTLNEYNLGNLTAFYFYSTFNFNCDVYKIELGLRDTNEFETQSVSDRKYMYIKYFDSNDEYCVYDFTVSKNFLFNTRIYYLVSSDNLTDNQLYNQGYQQGLLDNQTDIYNSGYSAGQIVGYDTGYNAGVSDSSDYSFISLFGAVLDAPIQTIRGLFNFNLLGVNLLSFFTGLFTLAVILFVVKLILGGK